MMKWKRLVFDLDNIIATCPASNKDYVAMSEPDREMIEIMKDAKRKRIYIIIYTARRMRTYKNNVGEIIANVGEQTLDWLKKYNVPYDELIFGKPYADYYIDDSIIGFDRKKVKKQLREIIQNEK